MSFVFVLVFSTAISNVLLIIFLCFQMLAINTLSFVGRLVFVVCNGALELINYLFRETPQIRSLQIQNVGISKQVLKKTRKKIISLKIITANNSSGQKQKHKWKNQML